MIGASPGAWLGVPRVVVVIPAVNHKQHTLCIIIINQFPFV